MKREIILKNGWIKIDKKELDKLRQSMRYRYENDGGSKNFNSHLPNYEELRSLIRTRIKFIEEKNDIEIKILGQDYFDVVPGNTFFRDLFYNKRNDKSPQFQEYNIDVCFLYAYGKTRFEAKTSADSTEKDREKNSNSKDMSVVVSSTMNNMTEADKIKHHLTKHFQFFVDSETRNSRVYSKGSIKELYSSLGKNSFVFILLSRDYLQNESCVKELLDFIKNNLDLYMRHTVHIILKDLYDGDFNIYDSLGRSELLKYWKLRIEQLEENHKMLLSDKKEMTFYKNLRRDFDEIKLIIEELHRLLDLIRNSPNVVLYEMFLSRIDSVDELKKFLPKHQSRHIDRKLETTYKRIKIPSNNNPEFPEFPPKPFYEPKFPASDTFKIEVPGFSNVWLKDESTNPTGTHKDRLAWEVVIKYKSLIEGLKYKDHDMLPQMSIISSGSAAIAIQYQFNLFNIPTKLKVLVDINLNDRIKQDIKNIGCELYEYDLSERLLGPEDIKELTDNKNGIDITYREVLDPAHDNYYDWMSYEILKENPEYCFVPFGTGDLFINILNIVKIEYFNSFVGKHDPRFFNKLKNVMKCHYLGASSNQPNTLLDKLYSNFLPSLNSFRKYIHELVEEYACVGKRTNFYYVEEEYVKQALNVANNLELNFEPSGMAGLALLIQMKDTIPNNAKILIVNTGKTKHLSQLLTAGKE